MKSVFKSPGVYTKEEDVSGYIISKEQIRKYKISKILGLSNPVIYARPHGSTELFPITDFRKGK